jgi:hypothetical protein
MDMLKVKLVKVILKSKTESKNCSSVILPAFLVATTTSKIYIITAKLRKQPQQYVSYPTAFSK